MVNPKLLPVRLELQLLCPDPNQEQPVVVCLELQQRQAAHHCLVGLLLLSQQVVDCLVSPQRHPVHLASQLRLEGCLGSNQRPLAPSVNLHPVRVVSSVRPSQLRVPLRPPLEVWEVDPRLEEEPVEHPVKSGRQLETWSSI